MPKLLPLIIDLFAGGGGASTGIERTLGRSPDVAINHSRAALAMHEANHPDTLHLDSNIWNVEPEDIAKGRKIGLLWASPDCKHFSKAKGGAVKDRNIRDLAWNIIKWAEMPRALRPDVILMENVEEFVTWCPVGEDGQPLEWLKGSTFDLWIKRLRKAGYRVQWRTLRACDYGDPTIRRRWFLVARCDGQPITWPEPTHGDPASKEVRDGKRKAWRTSAECIDWSQPCPSIFETSEEIAAKHGLRAKRPLAEKTLARIARGMARYVLEAKRPFVVNLTHGARLEDLNAPIRTITGANRGEKALICPSITRFNGGATGSRLDEPAPTVTANSYIKRPGGAAPLGIVTPSLLSLKGTERRDRAVTDPHPTVLAGGGHSALVCPTLIQTGYGERKGQAPRALDIGAPLGTVVAGGAKHAVGAAFLAQHNGGPRMGAHAGHDARAPISTVTATGAQQTPVAALLAKYYGTGDGAALDDPMHTVTVRDRFGHAQAALSAPPFSPAHEDRARAVADFLRAHGAWDGGEFVTLTIDGAEFVIVDIGLRMLTPRELYRAQGFPDDYVIEGTWEQIGDDWKWKPFTKSTQVSCCGNSVPPGLAAALASANCQNLRKQEIAA